MIKWGCNARDSHAAGLETSFRYHVCTHFSSSLVSSQLDSFSLVPTALFDCLKSSSIVALCMHHNVISPLCLGHRPVYGGLLPHHRSPRLFRISDVHRMSRFVLLVLPLLCVPYCLFSLCPHVLSCVSIPGLRVVSRATPRP
jgi:hypothetical protein